MTGRICRCLVVASLVFVAGCRGFFETRENPVFNSPALGGTGSPERSKAVVKEGATDLESVPEAQQRQDLDSPLNGEETLLPRQASSRKPAGLNSGPMPTGELTPLNADLPQETSAMVRKTVPAPRAPDFFYQDRTLTEDTTWQGTVVVEGGVTVAPQTTLTVEPGTVVRFRRGGAAAGASVLVIQGRIQVNGTSEQPVLFTSAYEQPFPGDWQGIVILASEKKNLFTHARVEGAETGLDGLFSNVTVKRSRFVSCRTGIRLQDALFVMTGGEVRGCFLGGAFSDSETDIRDAEFSGNRHGIAAVRTSLYLVDVAMEKNSLQGMRADECRIRITGARVAGNGSGLALTACEGAFFSGTVAGNGEYGLRLGKSRIKVTGNEITKNGIGLWVRDGLSVAWGNSLFANGIYDLYNEGAEDFRAIGNWWGEKGTGDVDRRIYGRQQNPELGRIYYLPVLPLRPKTGS